MKRDNSALSVLALTVVVPLWLLSVSIAAADQKGGSDKGGGGGQASAGTASSGSAGSSSAGSGDNSGDRATYRGDPGTRKTGDTVPPYSRPRDGKPSVGEAVPRHGPPPVPGGNIYVPGGYFGGYYPWGYGGVGLGGYYGGFYDPCYGPYDYFGYGCGGYGGYGGGFGFSQSYGFG